MPDERFVETDLSGEEAGLLERAVELGRRGWGRAHPNPLVGCVLAKDGELLAEAWHQEYGGPHAEALALEQAGLRARGSTAYVSLEPCNHFGKTPPCSGALLEAGVVRVVYGWADPGSKAGGGGEALRAAGVEVLGPCLSPDHGRLENPGFFFNQEKGATYVALKLAQTLDGRIAEAPGKRTAITGPEAGYEVHRIRAGFDGILVGAETALVDDPELTVREGVPMRTPPVRVILDSLCRLSPEARMFRDAPEIPIIVFTSESAGPDSIRRLETAGAAVECVPPGPGGLSLDAVLGRCWERGLRSLLCEGGGKLATSLLREHKAARIFLFVAPFVLGEKAVPAFPDASGPQLWQGWTPAGKPMTFGSDVLLTFQRMG